MQTKRAITRQLFMDFTSEAAKNNAVYTPECATALVDRCVIGAQVIREEAREISPIDDFRSDWIKLTLERIKKKRIPDLVELMIQSANENDDQHHHGPIIVIDVKDEEHAFLGLCPGFWPFC